MSNSIVKLGRGLCRALPWIVEAGSYAFIYPLIVPAFGNLASLVFLCQFVVGFYADRKLWISLAKKAPKLSSPELSAAVWPICFALMATVIFGGATSLVAILPKVAFLATIAGILKYLCWELQNLSSDR